MTRFYVLNVTKHLISQIAFVYRYYKQGVGGVRFSVTLWVPAISPRLNPEKNILDIGKIIDET